MALSQNKSELYKNLILLKKKHNKNEISSSGNILESIYLFVNKNNFGYRVPKCALVKGFTSHVKHKLHDSRDNVLIDDVYTWHHTA